MENKPELTAADLALCLGQDCKTPTGFGVIDAVSRERIMVEMDGGGIILPPDDVWPILRPLSDMTEEEKDNPVWDGDTGFNTFSELVAVTSPVTRYLLSQGFDLFGWIPAGLAIDKTKL